MENGTDRRMSQKSDFAGETDRAGRPHLTPTQIKVLEGVHSGLLNKQIAFDLGIAEATVKAHMTALMRKLNVRNRTQVALAAQSYGWQRAG
jgi:DNA-binding NarL/FixJ family response regulator